MYTRRSASRKESHILESRPTANPQTKNLGFQGFDSVRLLISKGWNSEVHGECPRKLDSMILGLRILSARAGREEMFDTLPWAWAQACTSRPR